MCRVPTDAFVFIDVSLREVGGALDSGSWRCCWKVLPQQKCDSLSPPGPLLPLFLFFKTFLNGLFMHLFDYVFIYILMGPVGATQQQRRRLGGLLQILELLTR